MDKKSDSMRELLGGCVFFSQLPAKAIDILSSAATIRAYNDRQMIFYSGRKADGFYVILSGQAEIFRASENGREQILHIIEEGEICGEVPLFEGASYPASARARGAARAIYIDGERFLDIAFANPEILLEMLAVLSRRLRKFVELIDDLSLKDVSARLEQYLGNIAKDGIAVLDCSKTELANRLGTLPETISRAFSKLKAAGMISIEADMIKLLNQDNR